MTEAAANAAKRERAPYRAALRGFTFIELVLVIVILSIIAGAILPRLVGWKSRRGEQSVQEVANLLTAAAKYDTFSTNRAAIEYDSKSARFRLMTLKINDVRSFDPGAETWQEDPLAPAASLEGLQLVAGAAGGLDLDLRRFRIEFPGAGGAQGRAGVVMVFADETGSKWLVRLPSTGTRAEVTPTAFARGSLPASDPDAIDLDATGGRDEPW